ncbi:MAG: Ku protein, partial [Solirubrobacterales bacterium]
KDGARIKQKRFCAVEDVEVPYEEIVKGYEVSPGNYVVIEPDELSAISPERSRAIELEKFIDASEIDPLHYDASYFVLPDKGADQPYALLREAMAAEKRAAVARLVIHQKEHLVALWPRDGVLVVSTLHFAQEVSDPNKFDTEGTPKKATSRTELAAARQLISALSDGFNIADYEDEYREQVLDLIEAKAKGKKIAKAPTVEAPAPTSDLMSALEESLASLPRARTRGSKGTHKTAAKRHTAAKKTKTPA